jgi:hypothetical protein
MLFTGTKISKEQGPTQVRSEGPGRSGFAEADD